MLGAPDVAQRINQAEPASSIMLPRTRALDSILVAAATVLSLLVFYQPLRWLVGAWLSDPYYSHGFLIPLISVALVWRLWPRLKVMSAGSSLWGAVIVALGLAMTAIAISQRAYFAASLALPIFAVGLVLYLRGWVATKDLLFPISYLLLMIPLPFINSVAFELQIWTSTLSTALANLLAVPAQQEGASVSIPGAAYVVGLACSGLSSIIALLALGLLLVYLLEGPLWAKMALALSIVPIAIVANGLRISSLLWVAYRFGSEAGLVYHDTVAGFLSWGLALVILIVESRLLRCRLNLIG